MPADPLDSENATAILASQTESQLEAIAKDIQQTQPLTSEKVAIQTLTELYPRDSPFQRGVYYLAHHYRFLRKVRGDGNCYYRALLYSLCECLLNDEAERQRVLALIQHSLDHVVVPLGYDRFALEMFHDELVDLLESLSQKKDNDNNNTAATRLHTVLNDETTATSDYGTWYLRILTACHLKADPDRFIPFLMQEEEDNPNGNFVCWDIPTFCAQKVEPMGKECGMVQVLALAESLGILVTIEYLDGRDFTDRLTQHVFGPPDAKTQVTLLYRPGHYDILYKD